MTWKIICSRNTAKKLSNFTNFPANIFLFGVRKNIYTTEGVSVTIGNPAFCLALYLTGVHFREELQYVGEVSEQKCKCRPIRTREMGGVRLSEALHVHHFLTPKNFILEVIWSTPHSWSKYLYISIYFFQKIFVSETQ